MLTLILIYTRINEQPVREPQGRLLQTMLVSYDCITNYHKCGNLKQQRNLFSQCRGQMSKISFTRLELRYWQGHMPPQRL